MPTENNQLFQALNDYIAAYEHWVLLNKGLRKQSVKEGTQ